MDKNKNSNPPVEEPQAVGAEAAEAAVSPEAAGAPGAEAPDDASCGGEPLSEADALRAELDQARAQLEKAKSDYLFLMAEFDNFRKRTLKEKGELIRNGGEGALRGLLPVIDDFERSLQAVTTSDDAAAIREGIELIYSKFVKYLDQNGVKAIDSAAGVDFDTELHEAVTTFPAPDASQRGKVIDTVQKGYTLHDKVLRHAKVVVGQ